MTSDPHSTGHHRRQFGRRETSRAAHAQLPGGLPVACTVLNLSEGGALIEFPAGAVPTRNFRLTVDGAPYTLMCEPRHQRQNSVGVKFLNLADGTRLMGHLFPGVSVSGDIGDAPRMERPDAQTPAITNRDLRQKVLTSLAERAAAERTEARTQGRSLWSSLSVFSRKKTASEAAPAASRGDRAETESAADQPAASDTPSASTDEPTSPAALPAA